MFTFIEVSHVGAGSWIISMTSVPDGGDDADSHTHTQVLATNLKSTEARVLAGKFRKVYQQGARDRQNSIARRLKIKE